MQMWRFAASGVHERAAVSAQTERTDLMFAVVSVVRLLFPPRIFRFSSHSAEGFAVRLLCKLHRIISVVQTN